MTRTALILALALIAGAWGQEIDLGDVAVDHMPSYLIEWPPPGGIIFSVRDPEPSINICGPNGGFSEITIPGEVHIEAWNGATLTVLSASSGEIVIMVEVASPEAQ